MSYQYPGETKLAIQNINLEIRRGEFVGIMGPTGSGKTTLCLALNGIVPQFFGGRFFGKITVAGLDTVDTPVRSLARHVGQVFEDPETQLIATSVENEVAFPLENLGYPANEIQDRITWALLATGLSGLEKKHPKALSGGQKQRLAIASAIAVRPEVLVLDEPTSQLDGAGVDEVLNALDRVNQIYGVTILMVTHSAEQLVEHAHRILLIMGGELAAQGSPREVFGLSDLLAQAGVRSPEVMEIFKCFALSGYSRIPSPLRLEEGIAGVRQLSGKMVLTKSYGGVDTKHSGHPMIELKGVKYRFPDGTSGLNGIDLTVQRGEYILLAGRNGAGKTTLVKTVLRLLQSQEGKIEYDGADIKTIPTGLLARKIGYVGQNPDTQLFTSSVWDEVAFALRFQGLSDEEVDQRVRIGLETVGLFSFKDHHPYSLPKGDRARVVIAAVLALLPEVVIFDEPTIGQDFHGARKILDLTQNLHREGKTVIVITHHLYLMAEYAERMVVLDQGKVVLDAPLRKAFHAIDPLKECHLDPPPSVYLARELSRFTDEDGWQLTVDEICDSIRFLNMEGY